MRLKISGGPHDGQMREINGAECIELVRFEPVPMTYGEVLGLVCGSVEKTSYTVRRLQYRHPDGSIEDFYFLAPVFMTDIESIKHQFRK